MSPAPWAPLEIEIEIEIEAREGERWPSPPHGHRGGLAAWLRTALVGDEWSRVATRLRTSASMYLPCLSVSARLPSVSLGVMSRAVAAWLAVPGCGRRVARADRRTQVLSRCG